MLHRSIYIYIYIIPGIVIDNKANLYLARLSTGHRTFYYLDAQYDTIDGKCIGA